MSASPVGEPVGVLFEYFGDFEAANNLIGQLHFAFNWHSVVYDKQNEIMASGFWNYYLFLNIHRPEFGYDRRHVQFCSCSFSVTSRTLFTVALVKKKINFAGLPANAIWLTLLKKGNFPN